MVERGPTRHSTVVTGVREGPCGGLWSVAAWTVHELDCCWGPYWCPWPMLVSLVCAGAEGHTNICGLLPLETMLRFLVRAVARNLGKVCSMLLLTVQGKGASYLCSGIDDSQVEKGT